MHGANRRVSTGSGSDRVRLSRIDNHGNPGGPDAMVVVSYTHTQSLPLLVLTSGATLDLQIDTLVYVVTAYLTSKPKAGEDLWRTK